MMATSVVVVARKTGVPKAAAWTAVSTTTAAPATVALLPLALTTFALAALTSAIMLIALASGEHLLNQ